MYMNKGRLYSVMALGSGVGLIASFLQLLEKITLLKNADAVLTCNIDSVFSCTNVLNAWQSSVFGFPNSLMCVVFFAFMLGVSLAGISSPINKRLRLTSQAISVFFLGFGLWFLEQSTFAIEALCIFCIFCYTGLIMINATWLRLNTDDLPFGKYRYTLNKCYKKGTDIFGWVIYGLVIALVMLLKFR